MSEERTYLGCKTVMMRPLEVPPPSPDKCNPEGEKFRTVLAVSKFNGGHIFHCPILHSFFLRQVTHDVQNGAFVLAGNIGQNIFFSVKCPKVLTECITTQPPPPPLPPAG